MTTRRRIICFILSALCLSSCAVLVPEPPQRVVRVKVLADVTFRARNPRWSEEARGLIESASDYYEREFGIRFVTESVVRLARTGTNTFHRRFAGQGQAGFSRQKQRRKLRLDCGFHRRRCKPILCRRAVARRPNRQLSAGAWATMSLRQSINHFVTRAHTPNRNRTLLL